MKQVEGAGRLCYKREFSFLFNISNSHSNLSVLWDNSVDPDRLVALTGIELVFKIENLQQHPSRCTQLHVHQVSFSLRK